jgi:UDPglucose--hexose-1-phosphate uridylyltransferase
VTKSAGNGYYSSKPSEIRQHYYLDQFVIVAPSRHKRPNNFVELPAAHTGSISTACPFCNVSGPVILALPSPKAWGVQVIANAFPALSLDNPAAYGVMELVIETPEHTRELSTLPINSIELVIEAYIARLGALKTIPGIRYVTVFKNDGPLAGTSISHAHSQILAMPFVPPQVELERDALNHYHDKHASCAVCDLISWELTQTERVVALNTHMITIAPYAPSHPYEAWILPRRHIGSLEDLNGTERRALAIQLKAVITRLDSEVISYNLLFQESLPDQDHHLMIKIEPRLPRFFAGAELGTGVIITSIAPETAAVWYKSGQ